MIEFINSMTTRAKQTRTSRTRIFVCSNC